MASFNKVILLGNLTRDPEVRYTPKGSAVCDLGIAINRQYTLDSGEKREEVTYVDVVLWARLAEIAGEYLKKGRPIFIEGRLQLDTWDDKQSGQKRSKLRVIGETMQLLGGRPPGAGGAAAEGAEIEQVQKMDKRQFSYVSGPLDAGFYVNFIFHADPQLVTKLRSKFKLDPAVYRQHYQRLRAKNEKNWSAKARSFLRLQTPK